MKGNSWHQILEAVRYFVSLSKKRLLSPFSFLCSMDPDPLKWYFPKLVWSSQLNKINIDIATCRFIKWVVSMVNLDPKLTIKIIQHRYSP